VLLILHSFPTRRSSDLFFIMNSGLRSLRDKALLYFEEAFAREIPARERLYRVVNLYAAQIRRIATEDKQALKDGDLRFNVFALRSEEHTSELQSRFDLV